MHLKKLVPLVTVKSLAEVKDFYTTHFSFTPTMESEGYLSLAASHGAEIAFMKQDTCPPALFSGEGLTLCLEVTDIDAEAARLSKAGLPVVVPLRDNPWGDRSIIFRDPVGIHVYVYQSN